MIPTALPPWRGTSNMNDGPRMIVSGGPTPLSGSALHFNLRRAHV
jgi:hypothetical protein